MVRAATLPRERTSPRGWVRAWVARTFVFGPTDKTYRRLLMVMLLLGLGAVLSATFPLADKSLNADDQHEFVTRQLLFGGAGLLLMLGTSYLAPAVLVGISRWAFPLGLATMLMCRYSQWAHYVDGCWGWLKFGEGKTVQPSEMVKVFYVAFLAMLMASDRRQSTDWPAQKRVWAQALLAMGAMCGVLLIQQDLGMIFVVFATTLAVLFLRGIPWWQLVVVAVSLGTAGGLVAKLAFPERWNRVLVFLDPFVKYREGGEHVRQMLGTLARGGVQGSGLGMCPDKWGALPTPHTDSIFCVVGAELGLLGALLVLGLVFMLASRSLRIGLRSGDTTAWYLASGMGLLLAIQAVINIAVATAMMPCTGLTLPFISAGGSSLVASLTAAGVVLAVSRMAHRSEGRDLDCG